MTDREELLCALLSVLVKRLGGAAKVLDQELLDINGTMLANPPTTDGYSLRLFGEDEHRDAIKWVKQAEADFLSAMVEHGVEICQPGSSEEN